MLQSEIIFSLFFLPVGEDHIGFFLGLQDQVVKKGIDFSVNDFASGQKTRLVLLVVELKLCKLVLVIRVYMRVPQLSPSLVSEVDIQLDAE